MFKLFDPLKNKESIGQKESIEINKYIYDTINNKMQELSPAYIKTLQEAGYNDEQITLELKKIRDDMHKKSLDFFNKTLQDIAKRENKKCDPLEQPENNTNKP